MAWKKLSSKEVFRGKWLGDVTVDEFETDTGKKVTWETLRKPDFSLIIPFDGEKLVLVGQYRPTVELFSWEFPMGSNESGESVEENARRELQEEAGLLAGSVRQIAKFYVANGHCTQACHVFLAEELTEGKQDLSVGEEGMEVKRMAIKEVSDLINDGTIKDGPTIAAFAYLHTSGWIKEHGLE